MGRASLAPLTLAGCTLPNRIVRPPHTANNTPDGRIAERFIAFHEEAAKGGVGLTIIGGAAIHPSSMLHPNGLAIWDEASVEGLQRFMARMQPYPMRVFVQLWHGGHNAFTADGSPPWSASATPGPLFGVTAVAMTRTQIAEIVESYRAAAARAATAGLHGVEVHAGHGYLLRQFLASALNRRTDEYGGSLENRARFLLEVMRAVRGTVPKGFAVGVRMGPETRSGLLELDDMLQVLKLIESENLVDYVSLTLGEYTAPELMAAPMHEPAAYQLRLNGSAKSQLKSPILVTGRFRTLDEADDAILTQQADLVGMVRAHLADPHIVRKTVENRVSEIRPCVACNQMCIGGLFSPLGEPGCAVNPVANHEAAMKDAYAPAAAKRKVLVIGGGVAGMEAARVAALRGHQVHLIEAASQLGGTVRAAARAPRMGAFGDIARWHEDELRRLGVQLTTGRRIEAADVQRETPDAVIVATGARPRRDGWQRNRPGHVIRGLDRARVIDALELLSLPRESLGRCAVVLDDVGHYEGIAVTEFLIDQGLSVAYVTRHAAFAPLMDATFRAQPAYARLHRSGRFRVHTRAMLSEVDAESATLFDPTQDAAPEKLPADLMVFVGFNTPNNELVGQLADFKGAIHVVGDALSPRFIESAIAEGHRAGLAI